MKALHWNGRTIELKSAYPDPEPVASMALVRVRLAGVCATDLEILKGYLGFQGVPGHEFVGEVVEGPREFVGTRVVGEINFACGSCEYCARDLGRHCPTRRTMGIAGADGSFAEHISVPVSNLHRVPESVPDEAAVFTEPLAAAYEILDQVEVDPSKDILVLGDGKLGLLCAQALQTAGARVTLVGKHERKLALARSLDIHATLLEDWKPRFVDMVVEATGSTSGLRMAIASLRPRGTLVLKSTVAEDHQISAAPLVIHEMTLVGSRCGRFPPALRALESGAVSVAPLIDKIYPLTQGLEALAHAAQPGVLKVLMRCS